MNAFPFQSKQRVKKQSDFDRVYQNKAYAADAVLVLRGCRNELGITRLGLSVSRKVGNAVVRNRWKRRIREAFRLSVAELPPAMDLVARPRQGAVCDAHAIRRSLPKLAQQLARRIDRQPS